MVKQMDNFKFTQEERRKARIAIHGSFKLLEKVLKNPDFTDKLPRKIVLGVRGKKLIIKSTSSKRKAKFLKELLTKN